MMMNKDALEHAKQDYERIPIPDDFNQMIDDMCRQQRPKKKKGWIALPALAVLFVIGLNTIPVLAESLSGTPVIGPIARALTFTTYTVDEGNCRAEIDIAQITGLSNKELENTINQELRADGEALVHQFEEDVAELRELDGDAHMGFETDFDVMASNENVFSLRVMYHSMSGSSNTWYKFYNVNQKTGELITLDSLFLKGSDYLGTINTYLIGEMKSNTEADGKSIYAVNQEDEAYGWAFTGIESDHNFYINGRGHLVIAFDKYEVAAGYVGTPEFEIPTDIISDLLRPDVPVLK